jgi:hypothetical protein
MKPFVAGMCSMLVISVAVAWGGLSVQTRSLNDSGYCLSGAVT